MILFYFSLARHTFLGGGPTSSENAERQIQINYYKKFNFDEITHSIYQNKATLVVNPANVSDFKNVLQRKQTMLLSEDSTPVNKERKAYFNPAGATQNSEIQI